MEMRHPGLPRLHFDGGRDLPELEADLYYYRNFNRVDRHGLCSHCGPEHVQLNRQEFYRFHWPSIRSENVTVFLDVLLFMSAVARLAFLVLDVD